MNKFSKTYPESDYLADLRTLHEIIAVGQEIHCEVLHVSRSGMSRDITMLTVDRRDNTIMRIDYLVSRVLGLRTAKSGGITVGGCGMDMCFKLVYDLGCVMWANGTPVPHGTRNGQPDTNGGYALKYRG